MRIKKTELMRTIQNLLVTFLMSLFLVPVLGQNSQVSDAIQAYHAGDYQKAYDRASDALAGIDALSNDFAAAAYYYQAKSRIQLLRLAMESGDKEKLSEMHNALIDSYYDYGEALGRADNQLKADIEADLEALYNPILQTGLSALNTAGDERQPVHVREAALQAAKGYLEAAHDISPTYLAGDLLSQVYLAEGDSLRALEMLTESINAYKSAPPDDADLLMAYVFFRKALIERFMLHDHGLALSTIHDGQQLLKSEYERAGDAPGPALKQSFENGMKDLTGFELDIYLNDPSLRDIAIGRFREVIVAYPGDYDIHLAYATLLEKEDPLLAIDAYETAISLDESRDLAFFNIAALYNNLGSDYYGEGLAAGEQAAADSLFHEADQCFRKAYIYMEEAHRLNPGALETIRALIQLATTLGLDEKAEYYIRKEEEILNN